MKELLIEKVKAVMLYYIGSQGLIFFFINIEHLVYFLL